MPKLSELPKMTKELITFTLHRYRLPVIADTTTMLAYEMAYEGGVKFAALFTCRRQSGMLLFYEEALSFEIADLDPPFLFPRRHFSTLLRMPQHPHDMEFSMGLQAGFASSTRSVANALGGGLLLST